jgi:hypothetical protein
MKPLLILLPLLCLAASPTQPAASARFTYVDLIIDPHGQPLAAWQIEFSADTASVSLVGVESGEGPAYSKRPPYYDPAALAGHRIIVGDFSLDSTLPTTRTRVARLMLEIQGDAKPHFTTRLMAAANPAAQSIPVDVSIAQP